MVRIVNFMSSTVKVYKNVCVFCCVRKVEQSAQGVGKHLTISVISNSLKPVVRSSVRPSVRQNHCWARRALALCRS